MSRLRFGLALVAAVAALPPRGSALAALPPAIQALVDAYGAALSQAKARTPGRLEVALNQLEAIDQAVTRSVNGSDALLETLSEAQLEELRLGLPGAVVYREDPLFVAPDSESFSALAREVGDAADRRFFAVQAEAGAVDYVEHLSEFSGCIDYGSGKLVDSYHLWSQFQSAHPGRYGPQVEQELGRIAEAVRGKSIACPCGDAASVERELVAFRKAFPGTLLAEEIRTRLESKLRAQPLAPDGCRPLLD